MAVCKDKVLLSDMWIRRELEPCERSLVTISVLISKGKSAMA
jgi:alkylhydroperoxidase/carboxymuconolactone decarboxylase family protein YurZ